MSTCPGVDMFRMLGSGTEACMAAIRVARLATGKKNIIKMGGGYHGWSDSLVYALRIPGTAGFDAHGIPRASRKYTQEAFPNNIKSLERRLRRNRLTGQGYGSSHCGTHGNRKRNTSGGF